MRTLTTTILFSVILVACGGGGGGSPSPIAGPVASTLSFPLLQAINGSTASGESIAMTAIGTSATQTTDGLCSGTYSYTAAPATGSTTFQGRAALSAPSAITLSFTNCTPSSIAESGTDYYDSNYMPLGDVNASSGRMGLWQAAPSVPTTVRVGDVFIVGTKNYFTNTSGSVNDGRSDMTVVVEADTSTTAVINQIVKSYNAAGVLQVTTQGRSRINSTGNITRVSVDLQYTSPSTLHLVFRR
jgi:hypothetical protein